MPKRTSNDPIAAARRVVDESTQEPAGVTELNPSAISRVMAEMGRRGGAIGGKRRLETMTAERRREVASQAAQARWSKTRKPKKK